MLGFLIYLPNIYIVPHFCYVLGFVYIMFKNKGFLLKIDHNLYIILAIVFISLINRLLHVSKIEQAEDLFPWFVLIIVTFIISLHIVERDLKVLLVLIIIECIVVMVEFYKGVPSFFIDDKFTHADSGLLYFIRPYGFGNNSSGVAFNVLLGFYILEIVRFKYKWLNPVAKIFLLTALILTFNRTVIISILIFYLMNYIRKMFIINRTKRIIIISCLLAVAVFAVINSDIILQQFTRDSNEIDLSGRGDIWLHYLSFIADNILLGNGTFKYFVEMNDLTYHAHNSYLQVIANSGIIILILYLILIVINLNRRNIVYVFPLLVAALTQNIIFWGISTMEIMFFFFLLDQVHPEWVKMRSNTHRTRSG